MEKFLDSAGLSQLIANIKRGTPVAVVSGTTPTQQLAPNMHYSFGEVTALTVTLGSPVTATQDNVTKYYPSEYTFEFDSGSTATTLSLPASIVWQDGTEPVIAAGKHYEISIKYDAANQTYYGLWAEW